MVLSADHIEKDWTNGAEKPLWPLSSYGPAKYEPLYVTGLDMSPEEMRVKAYEARGNKQEAQYVWQLTYQAPVYPSDNIRLHLGRFRDAVVRTSERPLR